MMIAVIAAADSAASIVALPTDRKAEFGVSSN
jgi:hypothetical protein